MDKIEFYKERNFGDKFNVTFAFVKQNWKVMLRYITYFCLPLALLTGLPLISFVDGVGNLHNWETGESDMQYSFLASYGVLIVLCGLASWAMSTVAFSLIQAYNNRAEGLENITAAVLKPYFKRNAWRLFKLWAAACLLAIGFVLVTVAVAVVHPWLCFLMVVALFVVCVPLLHVTPVYIYEEIGVWKAFSRGFRLGWHTWGGTFALGLVLALLTSVAQGVISLPWQVCYILKLIFGMEHSESLAFTNSAAFIVVSYVSSVLSLFAQFVTSTLFFVGISYLYSHAAEQLDGMSVAEGIELFDQLADKNEDADNIDFDKL